MRTPKDVGLIIKEKRLEKGYTQKEIADMLFVSEKTISRWECGIGYPSLYIIDKLCSLLDISTFYLLDNQENEKDAEFITHYKKKVNTKIKITKIVILFSYLFLFVLSFLPLNATSSSISYFSFIFTSPSWLTIFGVSLYLLLLLLLCFITFDLFILLAKLMKFKFIDMTSFLISTLCVLFSSFFIFASGSKAYTFGCTSINYHRQVKISVSSPRLIFT